MSGTGRRRPTRARPATRLGARTTAALAALALGAAAAVPAAGAPPAGTPGAHPAEPQAAGAPAHARADQIRSREWHLDALRVAKAWKYSRGRGVTVAVLDTGVDKNHPDLTGQVVTGPDLTGGLRRPGSRYWGLHGTSMASIIAGHGHGPGQSQGMMGLAPQSNVLSIRVTLENDDPLRRDNGQQNGAGERDAVAQGIRYAVDRGADIINMSLGGGRQFYNGTQSQENAIKYALGKGVVLIASAGNDGSGANRKNFPAAYPGVIAVGALDRRLRLWKDSNRRSRASVCAPGVDIVSADASNGYVVGTGTSASSAIVAGVAALVRARYPRLTPAEVRQALIQGSPARPGQPTGSTACRGTVDALQTLYAAHRINKTSSGPVQTPPASPSPEAAAEAAEESGLLLPLVLGGGGALIVLGLVLGWRQRRRPDAEPDDTDAVPDYGLPAAPPAPRPPAAVGADAPPDAPPDAATAAPASSPAPSSAPSSASAPVDAPVNAPLWQSTDVYQGPAAPIVPSWDDPDAPAGAPPDGPAAEPAAEPAAAWDDSPLGSAPLDASSRASSSDIGAWSSLDDPPAAPSDPLAAPHHPLFGPHDPLAAPSDPLAAPHDPLSAPNDPLAAPHDPLSAPLSAPIDPPAASSEPPLMRHELRPFDPNEFSLYGRNGRANGHGLNGAGLNGHGLNGGGLHGSGHNGSGLNGSLNGQGLNGRGDDGQGLNGYGAGSGRHAGGPNDAGPARPADPEPPRDPLERPDDEPRGRHSRRSQPPDDEDYRPPWW